MPEVLLVSDTPIDRLPLCTDTHVYTILYTLKNASEKKKYRQLHTYAFCFYYRYEKSTEVFFFFEDKTFVRYSIVCEVCNRIFLKAIRKKKRIIGATGLSQKFSFKK